MAGAAPKHSVRNPVTVGHELAGWSDLLRLSWVTSYAFSPSHLGATAHKAAAVCNFMCTLFAMAISNYVGAIYTNKHRTSCVTVRRGGLFRLAALVGLPALCLSIALSVLTFIYPLAGKATLGVVFVFIISSACFIASNYLMALHERSRGPKMLLPAAKSSHSKRCPERRPILTITGLASVEYMAGVRLCLSLIHDPRFAGSCLRATARTSGLARGYRSFGFVGANPKNPKELYKH